MSRVTRIAAERGREPLAPDLRGLPAGAGPLSAAEIATRGWRPMEGEMSLPLLSLDLGQYERNRQVLFAICARYGCAIAPHVKTPMAPVLAQDLVDGGAWGVSVADLRQAGVMLAAGIPRVLIANQLGGAAALRRLVALAVRFPQARLALFVDDTDSVAALAAIWAADPALPPLELLVEIGCGRGGVASTAAAAALVAQLAALSDPRLRLAGIAAYEGSASDPDPVRCAAQIGALFARVGEALALARAALGPERPLILSAGGSGFFDHVIAHAVPLARADGHTTVLLRSGAAFFSDHGNIRDRLQAIAGRTLLDAETRALIAGGFQPALRLWAEVLTVSAGGQAICGFGLRDVAHDQGLPVPLRLWRDGEPLFALEPEGRTVKLNDQHGFVDCGPVVPRPGDVIELGIRHPCTTLDKHRLIYGLDPDQRVVAAIPTCFG